jgi:glycosyltransferase involved in cell wall biosynthesis
VKKLLHMQLLPLLSGVQNFSLHLLDGLPEDEFEIWVAGKSGGEFVEAVRRRGYRFVAIPGLRRQISALDLVSFVWILWFLARQRFDIVHTNTSKIGLLGRLAARLAGIPLIVHTAHGSPFQDHQSFPVKTFYKAMECFGNALGHRTVFVCESDRQRYIRMGLAATDKSDTIYNAIPPELRDRLAKVAEARREKAPGDGFVIGSTLRFSYQKNAVNLVAVACRACQEAPNLRFVFLGEGENLPLCKQMVRSHDLNGRILFPGWDTDIASWLAGFDAFVLYSRWESQPFSIIEAVHSGLAVIGSDIPSIGELVDGSCGWLVPLGDHKALVRTFTEASRDPRVAREKGLAAAARIRELCDYRKMVQGYLNIYRSGD